MTDHRCPSCMGCGFAQGRGESGKCRACGGTGREHIACPPCALLPSDRWRDRQDCPLCRGYGRLDVRTDRKAIEVYTAQVAARLAPAPAAVVKPARVEPPRVRVELVPETRVVLDDEACEHVARAFAAAEGSQQRTRKRRAA